jgi:hypothetical protein
MQCLVSQGVSKPERSCDRPDIRYNPIAPLPTPQP